MFVRVQVAVEGEGWMVRAINKYYYCMFERTGCVRQYLYLTCASLSKGCEG